MTTLMRFSGVAALITMVGAALTGCAPANSEADGQVTIVGSLDTLRATALQQELDAWGKTSGIRATYTTLTSFDLDLQAQIGAGESPDIALWSQPNSLINEAESGGLVPLTELPGFDYAAAASTLVPGWDKVNVATDGKTYGFPLAGSVKSVVYYNPAEFAKYGYSIPTTDKELTTLVDRIKADGSGFPWCAGIEAGGYTGWTFTDWVEQYVLDYYGPEVYNTWAAGGLRFDSPEVTKAVDKVTAQLLTKGNVNGGGIGLSTDAVGDTAPLFIDGGLSDGQCFMMRQGSFITDFFPENIKNEIAAGDFSHVGVFPFPAPADSKGNGVLGEGESFGVFRGHTDSDVAAVSQFLASDKVGTLLAAVPGFISPHSTFDTSLYPNALIRTVGETMANADFFGFDASTRMNTEVGGEFFSASTEYVAGLIDWKTAAERIQSKY